MQRKWACLGRRAKAPLATPDCVLEHSLEGVRPRVTGSLGLNLVGPKVLSRRAVPPLFSVAPRARTTSADGGKRLIPHPSAARRKVAILAAVVARVVGASMSCSSASRASVCCAVESQRGRAA